jgi:hypothetical protein
LKSGQNADQPIIRIHLANKELLVPGTPPTIPVVDRGLAPNGERDTDELPARSTV